MRAYLSPKRRLTLAESAYIACSRARLSARSSQAANILSVALGSAIVKAQVSAASAAKALREFVRGGIPFDAVFTNDEMATGVYRVLQENRIAIPESVSVCGCDDLPVGKQLFPELTSISLDCETLARHAAEYISDGSRRLCNAVHMELAPVLRPGASTAAGA